MKMKLTHPLWTHIPAIAVLIALIIFIASAGNLPAEAPVHFSTGGIADSYGSPWLAFGIIIAMSVLYISLSVFLDELWARQEKGKTFNWLSLLDDVVVGTMAGTGFGYLAFLKSGTDTFSFPWYQLVLVGGITVILAVAAELLRPFSPHEKSLVMQDTGERDIDLAKLIKDNTKFVYWDSQNPMYITLLTTLLPLIMFIGAFLSWFSLPWVSIILLVVGILLILPYGGQRTLVTRNEINIRFGLLGFRVLRLKPRDISAIELHDFSPLKDFGGYGIRFNRDMKAYFQRGTRGVKLTMNDGKRYLIGSDHPDQLSTVIKAVTETGN
ncbi:MAG: DUF1648 domain-containing protein [Dehalococcoidia bacterium]